MGTLLRLAGKILIAGTSILWTLLAAEMPSRLYTTQDGLARDDVHRIRMDSHGYLWFATAEGLSLFDGYQFTNYTVHDGLPNRSVTDILETHSGQYWIGTNAGFCRFDPRPGSPQRFTSYRLGKIALANQVNVLFERRDQSIWIGTEGGLWRLRQNQSDIWAEPVPMPSRMGDALRIFALTEDREGNLWAAGSDGLYTIWRDGKVTRLADGNGEHDSILDVLQDSRGRVWTATKQGVCLIAAHPKSLRDFVQRVYRLPMFPTALFESSDGKLWVSGRGLFAFDPDASEGRDPFQLVASPFGGDFLGTVVEDSDHNLWVAGGGVLKVTRHGFTRFSTADGLKELQQVEALIENRRGRVCPITFGNHGLLIHEFDGHRFTSVSPLLPPGFSHAWGDSQVTFQDRSGDWWLPTGNGVLRFAPSPVADLARAKPKATYTVRDGLPDDRVLRLFEDSRGDIWMGTWRGLARWRRSTGLIQAFSASDGLQYATGQPLALGTPQSLAEDRAGQIWVGFHPFGLARYRDGRFDFFTEADGLPKGQIHGLYADRKGRLWVASSQGGTARIDDVSAQRPAFQTYTVARGLSSDQVFTVVEDNAGRIYLGGGKGIDRLDPETGSIRHFTTPDGIPPVRVQYSLRDHNGALWFASGLGLSRYTPEPEHPSEPRPPLIRLLRIAGRPSAVSELGESDIAGIRLDPSQNNLHIEFASQNFASGEVLRYQYRLEGADRDWSPPTDQRTVNYSSLPPDRYRFVVKAINGEGRSSAQYASVSFVILPPVWRQSWFLILAASGLGAALYGTHRYRVRQLLHLERIRTRLASDLHDDIGSGLAEIAILTEVAELQPVSGGGDLVRRAGDRARQLREAMSDIVWSVDPQHGSLTDLVGRVRQSVFSLMETNGRRVTFEAPPEGAVAGRPLGPDRARQVLLITKEALTNVSKHAGASEVVVRLHVEDRCLVLEVQDDGCGFDPKGPHSGMGLRNLRRRAVESGGDLTVDSSPGQGARLRLTLPLGL